MNDPFIEPASDREVAELAGLRWQLAPLPAA